MPVSTAASCPPAPTPNQLLPRMLESGVESWKAAGAALGEYWSSALVRGASPLDVIADVAKFWNTALQREKPRWHTPHEVVLTSPVARLRDFSQGSTAEVVPTLVLPPQAGHDSCIVDYSDSQSQVKTIRAAGLERVWSLDWIGATEDTKDSTVDDYLDFIDRSIEHIGGGPVNLVGDCQGGWLATIYAALRPEKVNTLTIAGAPIDFHGGEAAIYDWVQVLDGQPDLGFYRSVVALGNGVLKGEFMLNGFILMKPENEIAKQVELFANVNDPEHVARYQAFETWFKHVQDIPGAFYLWIVEHLFRDNKLINRELEIRGETVDLSRISCPVNLMGGETDHITPPAQVFALADHVSTPADQIHKRTTTGGHLGLFMGGEALREHWPPLMAEVLAHSKQPPVAKGAAAKRSKAQTTPHDPAIPAP
jgi:poly(3-hydroxybutyrate) depolymerase